MHFELFFCQSNRHLIIACISSVLLHLCAVTFLLCIYPGFFGIRSNFDGERGGHSSVYMISYEKDISGKNTEEKDVGEISMPEDIKKNTGLVVPTLELVSIINSPRRVRGVVDKPRLSNNSGKIESVKQGPTTAGDGVGEGATNGNNHGVQKSYSVLSYVRASPIQAPKPPFPYSARRAGFEGRVVLRAVIGSDGKVRDALIDKSSGRKDTDEVAVRTLKEKWLFNPALADGLPVESKEMIVVIYSIDRYS